MTAREIYDKDVKPLAPRERLRLAALILNDIASDPDYSDEWTDEDMRDLTKWSMERFEQEHAGEDDA